MITPADRPYSIGEEIAHSVTHGVGFLLALAATAVMVTVAAWRGNAWHVTSCAIYGATLSLLFLSSTLYHGLTSSRAKRVFKVLDHSAIYLLIAGTYTPFLLISLHGPWGWSLFGVIWGLALAGVGFKVFFAGRFNLLSTLIYIGMGWIVVIAIYPLWHSLSMGGLYWLVLGGVLYTGGTVFYLKHHVPYHHAVWHGFVLAGSICHFFSIMFHVIP